ncbi:MAG TPA: hypothetical protein VIL72_08580, partial [Beijerinckiaceae bacterium]
MTDIDQRAAAAPAGSQTTGPDVFRPDPPFGAPPAAAPVPAPAAAPPPAPVPASEPRATDPAGATAALRGLAELATHRGSGAPLTLALLGPPGSGKSFALGRLLDAVSSLARRATDVPNSPFLTRVVTARVEADAGKDPAVVIASSVYAALSAAGYAGLAQEAATAGADRQAAARAASERLIDLRRRLDTERQALQEFAGRKARLTETTLYRSASSRIDSWARANRSRIESRLRAFGFTSGDPIATYKDLVRDVADNRGVGARISAFLHAMWAFRGQTRLLVLTGVFLLIAWALGLAVETQPSWLAWLRGQGDAARATGDWLAANIGAFGLARTVAIWLAIACFALNVSRAARFVSPLYRGVSLLQADVHEGQRDLDALITNQTRLVDDLSTECDAQARRAEEAERRAAQDTRGAEVAASPFEGAGESASARQARGFFAALAMAAGDSAAGAPQRIVVAVDELDALPPQESARFLDVAASLLARDPFVTVVAADARRLTDGWGGDGAEGLARRVQAALRVDAAGDGDHARLVRRLLGAEAEEGALDADATTSTLDQPFQTGEAELLEALAPLAGSTPRRLKQFVNAYRLARGRTSARAPLALALALDIG